MIYWPSLTLIPGGVKLPKGSGSRYEPVITIGYLWKPSFGEILMVTEANVEGVANEGVDRLVNEIEKAVVLIGQLRNQAAELGQKNKDLQSALADRDRELSDLRSERDRLQAIYNENASLIDHKEEIQRKIEAMLSRLDTVNTA
jgi:predicted RNase H-like nuclease (RuvC/YqgF family)